MKELKDYGGGFKNDLKLEDFSKDFLIRMMRQWSRAYIKIDEVWAGLVKEKAGEEIANSCWAMAWPKIAEAVLPKLARGLDIQVNDVVDALKLFQIAPDGLLSGLYPIDVNIINRNDVIFSVTRCKTLEYLEKSAPHRIKSACQDIDLPGIERYLTVFLPNSQVKVLKIPAGPRKSTGETPACQFEFKN